VSTKITAITVNVAVPSGCRPRLGIVFGVLFRQTNLESLFESHQMKRIISSTLVLGLLGICSIGCDQKATVKEEKTIKTPGGTTTVTKETEIKKSGDHKDETTTTPNP